jgi:ankyrin repeat protein
MPYDGTTGLMLGEAIGSGDLPTVRRLLDVSAINDPISSAFSDLRALHIAAMRGQPAVCEYLLGLGADTSIVADVRQLTPLHCVLDQAQTLARAKENSLCCEILLKAGAPVNGFSMGHQTPLHRAVVLILTAPMSSIEGHAPFPIEVELLRTVEMLVDHQADPSAVPDLSRSERYSYLTPFQYAVVKNRERVIKLFIDKCDIDFGQRTTGGKTLLQLSKRQATKDLLRSTKLVRQVRDAIEVVPAPDQDVGPKSAGMSPL